MKVITAPRAWLLGLTTLGLHFAAQAQPVLPSILPAPAQMQALEGSYRPGASARIQLSPATEETRELGALAADILRDEWKLPAKISRGAADLTLALEPDAEAKPESYRLRIDASGIRLSAPTGAGLFYGLQTLRQIAEQDDAADGVAALRIDDAPRFGYRGMHLDVARHMPPLDYIKRQLQLMARYKFNTFHWHLTDDQGWRLEIKRYPELTTIGAYRRETMLERNFKPYVGDGKPYGGFYTQAQAREIVEYAKKLHIDVIPEIDMPGHMVAALAAYPELGCTPGPFEVLTIWGVSDDILCPSEQTFKFVEGVLAEVMDVFPSRYVHLGGDEAPTKRWEESALAQAIIKREGLKDEHALQGWFMRRVEKFVNARGRTMIGWDEILDGDPNRSAVVMSWRGMAGGIKAAQLGHDVIMSPVDYAYLDYCQGDPKREPLCIGNFLPLRKVYGFEPVPDTLTAEQARHILGGQANLWTEYLKTPRDMEYMLWPRALAMSEVLWSPKEARDWAAFQQRLGPQLAALDRMDVNYRVPDVEGLEANVYAKQARTPLDLRTGIAGAKILYTLDGSDPDAQSPVFAGPQTLDLTKPVVVSARLQLADGRLGPVSRAMFRHNNMSLTLATAPHPRYVPADALIDEVRGDASSFDNWVGWQGKDLEASLDLGALRDIRGIEAGFLQDGDSWIVFPREVRFEVSADGRTWRRVHAQSLDADALSTESTVERVAWNASRTQRARFVRVFAQGYGALPPGHAGAGHPAWLFADEIAVK